MWQSFVVRGRRSSIERRHHVYDEATGRPCPSLEPFRPQGEIRYNPKVPKRRPRAIPDEPWRDLFGGLRSNRDRAIGCKDELSFCHDGGCRALLPASPSEMTPASAVRGHTVLIVERSPQFTGLWCVDPGSEGLKV